MFIIGAVPDSLIYMKKKQKGYKFGEKMMSEKEMNAYHKSKGMSMMGKATGGRMK